MEMSLPFPKDYYSHINTNLPEISL